MDQEPSSQVPRWMQRYPPADITAAEFEEWVRDLFAAVTPSLDDVRVTLHDQIEGTDGAFDFDASVRYRWGGMDFLVIVEAKHHSHPIKRELVQILHSKVSSVGAHKGVMISTAPFQSGAVEFAKVHGIALVVVTEGRFTYETRAANAPPPISREDARKHFGLPTYVGHCYGPGETVEATRSTLISVEYPEYIRVHLLGVPDATG